MSVIMWKDVPCKRGAKGDSGLQRVLAWTLCTAETLGPHMSGPGVSAGALGVTDSP